MNPETRLVNRIKERFEKTPGLWFMKIHGSPFQMAGVPDIIGCYRGRFFGLEAKVGDNVPTLLQTRTMAALEAAGAIVAVVRSVEDAEKALELPPPIVKKKRS